MKLCNQKIAKRVLMFLIAALMAVSVCGCGSGQQAIDAPTATPDVEPLVTATPVPTQSTVPTVTGTPETAGKNGVDANLYVLGVYVAKTAYVDLTSGELMLPMQESLAELGIGYVQNTTENTMELTQDGASFAGITMISEGKYDLKMKDAEKVFGEVLALSVKNGAVYAPARFFEFIQDVETSINTYGDIFLNKKPEPTPPPVVVNTDDLGE